MSGGFDGSFWRTRLHEAGLRATRIRMDVIRALHASPSAAPAHALLEALAESGPVDRVTVYRALNALVEAGLAHKLDPGDRVFRFALAEHDANASGVHPHFVCDACGLVECLEGATVNVSFGPLRRGRSPRFKLNRTGVVLHGRCDQCAETEKSAE